MKVVRIGVPLALAIIVVALVMRMLSAQNAPDWISQGEDWVERKAELQAFGDRFETSEALFAALRAEAGDATPPTWAQMGEPAYDWSGIYTRTKGALQFDPDLAPDAGPASARLTPAGAQIVKAKADSLARTGGEYDPISDCRPPGTP